MKYLSVLFLIFASFVSFGFGQNTYDEEYFEAVKYDLNSKNITAVVHIKLEKAEIDSRIGDTKTGGGYTSYRLTGKVLEVFKGRFKKGQTAIFYNLREGQPVTEKLIEKSKIIFLENNTDSRTKKKIFSELENSSRSADKETLTFLRKLKKRS